MGDLSLHFSRREFVCKCGCGSDGVDGGLVAALEELRALLGGRPIRINSGVRCAAHNRAVGGVRESLHVAGKAADIVVAGVAPGAVAAAAERVGALKGIGRYGGFTHVDVRSRRARW